MDEFLIDNDSAWLLLAELNYRVGNELTAVASALRMARRYGPGEALPPDLLDQTVERLENFGVVHRLLDRHNTHGALKQRLEALCEATAQSKGAPNGILVAISADEVTADEETAWTVCVVAFELVTNSFRHAFQPKDRSVVKVNLREDSDWVFLTVIDNGMGFAPRDIRPITSNPGLGLAIVSELAGRLGGGVTRECGPAGTSVTVRFPARRSDQ
jgi:two-component sensor histidine kinase